jgi:hypothetical protein
MKALTTLMAIVGFLSLASGNETATYAASDSSAVVASARFPVPAATTRGIPAAARPWFADYPLTTDVNGARVYAADQRRIDQVRWALEQFADNGIALPHVEVWTHRDTAGCRLSLENETPFAGIYLQRGGVDTIYLCGTEFTLLHELAHVHDNNYLTDTERDRFIAIRRADSWRNERWHRAAGEHFADVVAWGLTGGEVRPSRAFPNDDAGLEQAFALALELAR